MTIKNKHKYKMPYLSLKTKLLLIVSFAVTLVGFCALLTMEYVRYERDQLNYDSLASALSYSVAKIEDTLFSINTISNLIMTDRSIQENLALLSGPSPQFGNSQAINELILTLQNYASTSEYISNISITTNEFVINTSPQDLSKEWPHLQFQITQESTALDGKIAWYPSSLGDASLLCTRNILKVKNDDLSRQALLCIRVDTEKIVSDCNNFSPQFQDASFILVNQSTPIYATAPLFGADLYALLIREPKSYYILELQGKKHFTVIKTLKDFEWNYICCVPYSRIFGPVSASHLFFFFIVILSTSITIILSRILIQTITKDFDLLVKKLSTFRGKHREILPTPDYYSPRTNELAVIHQHFDTMASEILALIKDNYTNQLLIKDATLKALEQQLNPHFLYNTLESINWRAKALGEQQISQMVEALGSLLRSSLSEKSDIIPLTNELEFIQNYITIQKIRYDERLIYELSINTSTESILLPKMSIQPLIENAIKYGVEQMTEPCTITLSIDATETLLVVQVKNTGSEFAPDLLTKLEHKEIVPQGFGLGLMNIDARVKLTYGESYGLKLHNEEDDIAIVTLTLPLKDNTHSSK